MLGGSVGGSTDWKLPLALAVTALVSSYIVRVPVMWRQAPITAALDVGTSKAAVCRTFKVPRSTLLDTLARVGWTPAGKL